MFNRDWLFFFTIGLILALGLVFAALLKDKHHPGSGKHGTTEIHSEAQQITPEQLAELISRRRQAQYADRHASSENERSERDLVAQEEMAKWARYLFWTSLVGVALLAGTLYETNRTAIAAQDAVRVTKDSAEKQLRAYVTMVSVHITQFEVGLPIKLEIRMKNCGQTPAYDYRGGYTMTTVPLHGAKTYRFNRPIEDATWSRTVLGPGIETGTLFPNNHILSKSEHDHVTAGSHALFVWGYDAYTDAFGKQQSMWFRYQHTGPVEYPQRMLVSPKGNGAT
jgi:hypothetical protein